MGVSNGWSERRGGEGSLLALYELVPAAEEVDLLEERNHQEVAEWFASAIGMPPPTERLLLAYAVSDDETAPGAGTAESGYDDPAVEAAVWLAEHLLGAEVLEERAEEEGREGSGREGSGREGLGEGT